HAQLKDLDAELSRLKGREGRRWFVNGQGQTFAVIEPPAEFDMGSPETEPERNADRELLHRMVIPRRFAIASKEVSIEQFQRFLRGIPKLRYKLPSQALGAMGVLGVLASIPDLRYKLPSQGDFDQQSPHADGPWIAPSWYMAAHYCNWLSQQEGLS